MKPDWLVCEKCLWWERNEESEDYNNFGFCRHSSRFQADVEPVEWANDHYCDQWTCKNCFGKWDQEALIRKGIVYKNHSKCEPAQMEE